MATAASLVSWVESKGGTTHARFKRPLRRYALRTLGEPVYDTPCSVRSFTHADEGHAVHAVRRYFAAL